MKVKVTSQENWINKLMNWVGDRDQAFVLNSCQQQDAYQLGAYEVVIGLGQKTVFSLENVGNTDMDLALELLNRKTWKFFTIAYDYKNAVYPELKSANHDCLHWPIFTLVEPECVITLTKDGWLSIDGDSKEVDIYNEINQQSTELHMSNNSVSIGDVVDTMSREEHKGHVEYIKNEIREGNMYEMNLCMETQLQSCTMKSPFQFYKKLIQASPTPFAAYVKMGGKHLMCASPERYLLKRENQVYSQPIKGTAPRFDKESDDRMSRLHLANSIKERAEHVMIVDLVRNDLSRVSEPGSVQVDELFGIYGYRQVYQMVSTISGRLSSPVNLLDLLQVSYPMGSMTGAPKHIVMQYIDQIEQTTRGWYSGTVGYCSPDGTIDSNVVIRSIMYDSDLQLAKYNVGGAITYDSDPDAEYQECLLKSVAIRNLLGAD